MIKKKTMNYNEARDYAYASIQTPRLGHQEYSPVAFIFVGLMGTAKSAMLKEVADILVAKHGYLKSSFDLSVSNSASVAGPTVDKESGQWVEVPNKQTKVSNTNCYGVEGSKPVIVCREEVGKADLPFIRAFARESYDKMAGSTQYPENSAFLGTSNLASEELGDAIPKNLRNRVCIIEVSADADVSLQYAISMKWESELIATMSFVKDELFASPSDYELGGKFSHLDIEKNPYKSTQAQAEQEATMRSLEQANHELRTYKAQTLIDDVPNPVYQDLHLMEVALYGSVGSHFTEQLVQTIRHGKDMVSLDDIRKDPETAKVSTGNLITHHIIIMQMLNNTQTPDDAYAFLRYSKRLHDSATALFVSYINDRHGTSTASAWYTGGPCATLWRELVEKFITCIPTK